MANTVSDKPSAAAKKSSIFNTLLLGRFDVGKLLGHGTFAKIRKIKTTIYFVMEYVGGGELLNNKVAKGRLKEREIQTYLDLHKSERGGVDCKIEERLML